MQLAVKKFELYCQNKEIKTGKFEDIFSQWDKNKIYSDPLSINR